MLNIKDKATLKGSYNIYIYNNITGELIDHIGPIENLIVSSSGYGRNLIMRQLTGDTTYPIEIDSAEIGTGTTAPADSDAGLQTPVVTGIPVADATLSNDTAVFTFFITNTQIANGTYSEFGLFCNGRLFARSLITPNFTKGSNQNAVVDYTISLAST